jgi:SecD-like export protein
MTLRSDIQTALNEVTPPAPHLAPTVVDSLARGELTARPRRRAGAVLTAAVALLLVVGLSTAVAVRLHLPQQTVPASTGAAPTGPGLTLSGDLVLTTWVKDPSVTTGPWAGHRPQIASFDRSLVATAHAEPESQVPGGPGDGTWAVSVTLDARGTQAFAQLTTAAAHACPATPGACAESHVTQWVGLTQDDVDHWNERANLLSQRIPRGKLLTDPYAVSPLTGGVYVIVGPFDQRQAQDLARWLTARG